jgi:Cep192 domain 4
MIDSPRSEVSRPMTGVLSVAHCLLPVGICFLALATAAWPQQSAEQTQTTRPIHIVRRIVGPNPPNPLGPTAQTATAHLDYYGGPVVSNLQVVVVFWGSSVSSVVTSGIGGFFHNITNSTYFDLLSEYASTVPPVGGSGGTNQSVGRGSYAGSFTIAPSICNVTPCTVTDSQLQSELISQIKGAHLPTPALDANGNVNTMYMIYFPPGVTIRMGTSSSCVVFCAYHGTTGSTFNSKNLAYGVMPDFGPTSGCSSGCGGGSEFQNITSVSSHEMAETVTDVDVGLATAFAPPLAWYDPNGNDKDGGGEIGDICNGQQSAVTTPGGTYTVQQIWSNQANACVSIGSNPSFQLSAPSAAGPGTSFNFTVTAQNPTSSRTDTSFVGTVHFTSTDSQAVLPGDFVFTPSDQGMQTFGATLQASGTQTITATDTVNSAIVGMATVTVGGGSLGALTFTPTSLIYGNQAIGTTSFAKKFTLTNSAGGTLSVAAITIKGTNAGDFAKTATTCGSTLAVNKSCTVSVAFTPGALGARSATLVITDAASNSPQQIALSGTGVVQVSVTPSTESFGGILVGQTSVSKVIKVKNNLTTTLTFSGSPFTFTGSDPGDFAQSATTCGSTLAALAHCTVSITFTPTTQGVRTAVLDVADSGNPSPQTANLSGTGK